MRRAAESSSTSQRSPPPPNSLNTFAESATINNSNSTAGGSSCLTRRGDSARSSSFRFSTTSSNSNNNSGSSSSNSCVGGSSVNDAHSCGHATSDACSSANQSDLSLNAPPSTPTIGMERIPKITLRLDEICHSRNRRQFEFEGRSGTTNVSSSETIAGNAGDSVVQSGREETASTALNAKPSSRQAALARRKMRNASNRSNRFKTQPITFTEIKEVDEESLTTQKSPNLTANAAVM